MTKQNMSPSSLFHFLIQKLLILLFQYGFPFMENHYKWIGYSFINMNDWKNIMSRLISSWIFSINYIFSVLDIWFYEFENKWFKGKYPSIVFDWTGQVITLFQVSDTIKMVLTHVRCYCLRANINWRRGRRWGKFRFHFG